MVKGKLAKVGDTNVSSNGYHYTRVKEGWRLTHHLLAEVKLGRPIASDERVFFLDKDKTNLIPANIGVNKKGEGSNARRLALINARIAELEAQKVALEQH